MRFEYDEQANAVYVYLRPGEIRVAQTRALDSQRIVDYDEHGDPVGIEFLAVSRGVDLRDLPYQPELTSYFKAHQIPIFA